MAIPHLRFGGYMAATSGGTNAAASSSYGSTSNQGGGPAGMKFQEAASVQTPGCGIMSQQQAQQAQQAINQQASQSGQGSTTETAAQIRARKEKEEAESLAAKGKDIAQGIMTTLMGGGEGGNLSLTPDFKDTLPAGMHPLRKQYEYLKEKYGPNWANTTQAKVLEGYLSGVPVERGGGLGAKDDTYGGGEFAKLDQFGNPIDPEKFEVAEKFRQQLLSSMGLAGSDIGGMNTMGTVAEQLGALSDTDYNKLRYGLSPEQFFNFNQQLMAADPSAGNEAYKAARPFSSGAGISTLFEKFAPMPLKALAGFLPERDLSGFENYADYEQAGAGFRPLPKDNLIGINTPSLGPVPNRPPFEVALPDPSKPKDPRYPFPIRPPFPPDGSKFPFPVGIASVFDPRFIGPSFRGSQYTNQGVSPAFLENLRRYYG